MKKTFLLFGILVVVVVAYNALVPNLNLSKSEVRSGTLVLSNEYCVLVIDKEVFEKSQLRCSNSQLKYGFCETTGFFGSDGLNLSFCKKNNSFLNKQLKISGIRVSGVEIGQDCNNRSCFKSVKIVR